MAVKTDLDFTYSHRHIKSTASYRKFFSEKDLKASSTQLLSSSRCVNPQAEGISQSECFSEEQGVPIRHPNLGTCTGNMSSGLEANRAYVKKTQKAVGN